MDALLAKSFTQKTNTIIDKRVNKHLTAVPTYRVGVDCRPRKWF